MPRRIFLLLLKKRKKKNKQTNKQEEIVYVNDDKENFNEEINLQNDKRDYSIKLDGVD